MLTLMKNRSSVSRISSMAARCAARPLMPVFMAVFVVTAGMTLAPSPVWAQASNNPEIQALLNRIDRVQRDMNTLQRQVYRGGAAPVSGADSPAAVGAPKLVPRPAAAQMAATTCGCAWPKMAGPHVPQ